MVSGTDKGLFNERETAGFLNVSVKTVQGWRYGGIDPMFHRLNANWANPVFCGRHAGVLGRL